MTTTETFDFQILTTSHAWRATPWDYSSLRGFRFRDDGTGELWFGYGQTIYAMIKCRFEVSEPKILRLTYLESPAFQLFRGFTPTKQNQTKEIHYKLTHGVVTGIESIIAKEYKFLWTVELARSPYPEEMTFPYEVPLIYYGHEEKSEAMKAT